MFQINHRYFQSSIIFTSFYRPVKLCVIYLTISWNKWSWSKIPKNKRSCFCPTTSSISMPPVYNHLLFPHPVSITWLHYATFLFLSLSLFSCLSNQTRANTNRAYPIEFYEHIQADDLMTNRLVNPIRNRNTILWVRPPSAAGEVGKSHHQHRAPVRCIIRPGTQRTSNKKHRHSGMNIYEWRQKANHSISLDQCE